MWISETSKISIYNARVLSIRHLRFCLFLGIHQEEQIFHTWCSSEFFRPWKRCFLLKTHHGFRVPAFTLDGCTTLMVQKSCTTNWVTGMYKKNTMQIMGVQLPFPQLVAVFLPWTTTLQVSRHPFAGTVRTADCHFTPGPVLWQPCQRPRKTARHLRMLGQFLKLYGNMMLYYSCQATQKFVYRTFATKLPLMNMYKFTTKHENMIVYKYCWI